MEVVGASIEAIEKVAGILKSGGLVILPTDTLYALSASALDRECIIKVYEAKGRDFKKPLSVMFHSLPQARKYVGFGKLALKIARKFLPGPLTIILPVEYVFPKELTFGSKKVGIRIPDNKATLGVLKKTGFPVTATSANVSGGTDPTDARAAIEQIGKKADIVLDDGRCKYSGPSTVIDLSSGEMIIVRKGVVPEEDLKHGF